MKFQLRNLSKLLMNTLMKTTMPTQMNYQTNLTMWHPQKILIMMIINQIIIQMRIMLRRRVTMKLLNIIKLVTNNNFDAFYLKR